MAKKRYRVLIGCGNAKKSFEPGDVVTDADFSAKTIRGWLALDKDVEGGQGPVLEVIGD